MTQDIAHPGVEDVIITDALAHRPARVPDYAVEAEAMASLAGELAERPDNLLQKLCDTLVELGIADSAGISLREPEGSGERFRWVALAGRWSAFKGGTMPFDASPCGIVIARDATILFERPERFFQTANVDPSIHELLLVPFHAGDRPIGTLWISAHDPERTFDAEDARLLKRLGRFASAAYRMTAALEAATSGREELERRVEERTRALGASEARFRALVTAGAYLLYRMSPDWREMHQLSGRDFLADTLEPIPDWADVYLLSEDRPAIFAVIAEAVRAKSLFQLEHRVRRADGGVGWVLSRAVPLLDEAGAIIEWFGTGSDVTGRVEAEEQARRAAAAYRDGLERQVRERTAELTASRDLLQATMDSSTDMIQVFEAVRDGAGAIVDFRWLLNNHTSESRFGEVRGQSLLERNPGVVREGIFDAFRRVAETGEPSVAERHYVHEQFDGWFFQSAVKLGDGVATTTKDITAWKAAQAEVLRLQDEVAEARLRASEERLWQFGEASSDVLWIRDAETLQWVYLTPAFVTIYGLDRETALRNDNMTNWLDLIVPEDREHATDSIRRVRAGGRVSFEYRIRRPVDGAVRWLRNTDFPIRNPAGELRWFGGVGRDITEEKAAAERQNVLVKELQHRSRNLLGVVTSLSNRTIGCGSPVESFTTRLKALGRAQALLSRSGSDTVEVEALVRAELAAHTDDAPAAVAATGPKVLLSSQQVQNFALAVHELATNAVKYGALRSGTGRLAVTWELVHDADGGRHLALDWVESGVDVRPEAATRRGYGRELIEQALAYALGGRTRFVLGADGVRCRIELPLD